ncbi:MAG TPA: hypothetical protein VGN41_09595 [Streptosporangiaceae bacterium]
MGSHRRARGQERAREFGRRHPRLTIVISCVLLAGITATCGYQLSYGTYLGRGWVIAALAGIATAAGLSAAALISTRRHGGAFGRAVIAWLVLGLMSASAIRYPFPVGPYGSVQAFFNVVHAALLGYEAVICAAIISLLAYGLTRLRGLPGRAVPQQPPVRSSTARAGHAPDRGGLPARLRFPAAEAPTWRAGRLIAADGTVTWLSRKGDVEVDLTSACQALLMLPTDGRKRQPRTTTLATADGLAEVDVSPKALETLASSLRRPPYGDTVHPAAQD